MARIFPFRALRYDPSRVQLSQVVTQPYDKITPAMQESYYSASPYNLVRIILGKAEAGDGEGSNVYSRAAGYLRDWRQQGVLSQDREPSFYVYKQGFAAPGAASGQTMERTGFIGLGQVEDYSANVVFRHEQTLSGPKVDRLNLLRSTRCHFGQIFMLYSDPGRALDAQLSPGTAPDIEVRDEYGVTHRVWKVAEPATIASIERAMADKKLIIADGHHRYETALNYRNERRSEAGAVSPDAPYERVMMTFVNMDSPGLVILPTHRVVHGLAGFSRRDFVAKAGSYFEVSKLGADQVVSMLQAVRGNAVAAVTSEGAHLLRYRPGSAASLLSQFSARQQKLDVVVLHKVLLEHVLGISEEAIRQQTNVSYLRDAAEAVQRVRDGADVAFLMNPAGIEQVREIAFAGEVLPQKSTDFYPKLLSGLAAYALE